MLNHLRSSVYALTVPPILPLLFVILSCKITKNPKRLPVDFKPRDSDTDWRDLHAFISKVDLPVSSLYRSENDGENIRIIVENKLINGLEINLECVIITFILGDFYDRKLRFTAPLTRRRKTKSQTIQPTMYFRKWKFERQLYPKFV